MDRLTAFAAVAVVPLLVFVVPFTSLIRFLDRSGKRKPPRFPHAHDSETAHWVDNVLGLLPWPWRHTCLKRSAVLYYLLRRDGRPISLHVGVKRDNGEELAAHAWLTLDDYPYLESDAVSLRGIKTIATFPE